MAIRLECGWDSGQAGTASVEITDGSGTFTLTMSAAGIGTTNAGIYDANTKYSHVSWSGSSFSYQRLGPELSGALNAESTDTYLVSYTATFGYQIQNLNNDFSLTFIGDEGERMRGILGFQGDEIASSTQTHDARSWYVIPGAHVGWSKDSATYDADGKSEGSYALGGPHYQVSTTVARKLREFQLALEERAKVFQEYAEPEAPWTFEDFFAHAGQPNPFLAIKDSDSYILSLRPEGSGFTKSTRVRANSTYDLLWSVNFLCWADGKL